MSMTGVCHLEKLSGGLKFGNGEVLGNCVLTVQKSFNPYLNLSDTCQTVIMSLSSICSGGLIKLCLYSSLS